MRHVYSTASTRGPSCKHLSPHCSVVVLLLYSSIQGPFVHRDHYSSVLEWSMRLSDLIVIACPMCWERCRLLCICIAMDCCLPLRLVQCSVPTSMAVLHLQPQPSGAVPLLPTVHVLGDIRESAYVPGRQNIKPCQHKVQNTTGQ